MVIVQFHVDTHIKNAPWNSNWEIYQATINRINIESHLSRKIFIKDYVDGALDPWSCLKISLRYCIYEVSYSMGTCG